MTCELCTGIWVM